MKDFISWKCILIFQREDNLYSCIGQNGLYKGVLYMKVQLSVVVLLSTIGQLYHHTVDAGC